MAKYFFEFKQLIRIGIPIFGSQLSYTLMGATDTIIAGRASANDLAGLAVGTAFSNTIWFFFTGIIFAVTPIVAQLYGAKKFLEIGQKLREILWVAAGLGLFMAFIFFNMDIIINLLPIKSSITSITIDYLKAVSIGWFFVTIFTCLRCYSEGMTYTKPVFYIAFAGMLLNIPLDLIFVYGWFGAPKLGGVGCGIATTIVSFIMMISIFIYISFSKNYKKTQPFSKFSKPSLATTKEVLKLGLPIGLGIFIELSMFSGAAIILSVLGEIVVASHSVAINIASLFFMVPLAIGLASSTRVGNLIGERNPIQAKIAATSTIMLCISGALINSVIIIAFGSFIVSLYTTELPVLELAVSLILFAAIFQLPDGIQMGALGSLRGYKDTFIPMILLLISYWVFAMPIGYYLTNYGFGIFIELSMFSGAAIILSVLGEIVVASHSVAINIASLFFMVPLAIGLASSTRVGNLIGEKNPIQAKIAATSTIMLCISGALINSVIIISFGSFIVGLYTTELPVLELAVSLILFAAIFQLPDGIQMGALGSLRGYKDTFIPMILLLISYWVFAMPIGYYLTNYGFGDPLGAKGMWFGMIIGLTIFSFLSIFRLRWVMKSNIKRISVEEPLPL